MAEARILLRSDAVATAGDAAEVERKLSWLELLWNDGFVRKTVIILFLAAVWEAYGTFLDNPLLFPTLHDTVITMFERIKDGTIPLRAWASLKVLFMGYSAGIVLAAIFTVLFVTHSIAEAIKIGNRILLLSPHPGRVKAELGSNGKDEIHPLSGDLLSETIHRLLFAEEDIAAEASL